MADVQDGFLGSIPRRVVDAVGDIDKRSVYQETYKGLPGRRVAEARNGVGGGRDKRRFSLYGDVNINNNINVVNNVVNCAGGK